MTGFKSAYENTLGHEGSYSNDPSDRGGETFRGISRKNWPNWPGWSLVDAIKKNHPGVFESVMRRNPGLIGFVEQFYYEIYWLQLNADALPQAIANELFDTAVNQGKITAVKYLQASLNKLNRNQKDYPDLKTDGGNGPRTIEAITLYLDTARFQSRNYEKLIKWLLKWMNYYQLKRYDLITNNDPAQEKFIPGWTERT